MPRGRGPTTRTEPRTREDRVCRAAVAGAAVASAAVAAAAVGVAAVAAAAAAHARQLQSSAKTSLLPGWLLLMSLNLVANLSSEYTLASDLTNYRIAQLDGVLYKLGPWISWIYLFIRTIED